MRAALTQFLANVGTYARFTDRARKVMHLANREAQRFNHEYIGTEHILLGLVKEGSGVAANVLKDLEIDLRKIRLEVEKIVQPGPDTATRRKLPLAPQAKRLIEHSIEEARKLNHNYVGTEHLFLGLLREQEGVAAQVLVNQGLKLEDAREGVLQLLGPPQPSARPLSLATRLSLWYGAWALLLLAAATGFLYWALCSNLDREDDEFLADKVRFLGVLLDAPKVDNHLLREEVEWEPAARQYGQVYVRVLDGDGSSLMETPGMSSLLPPRQFPAPTAAGAIRGVDVSKPSATYRVMAAAIEPKQGKARTIQVAIDRTHEERLLENYRRALWLVLGIALVICVLAGQRIARKGLRPLADMAETAGRIRSTTLHQRMDTAGLPAELESLAATFNEMLGRLQESFERLARFSADIAHELRNPVNNLRGEAEVALGRPRSPEEYREVLASSLEECARLSRLIDNLLFVARAEDPQTQIVKEPVDVGSELEAVRDFYGAAAAEGGVSLQVHGEGAVTARLDRTLFQRAVGNLVANSLAHTPAGGEIVLAACRKNGGVDVEVRDSGSGIAREHLPHVFDRFYRADPARSTSAGRVGLGLAIVKAIAALHRGSVAVSSEPGKGTLVSLHFPDDAA